jgi:hypothetical protein
MPTKPVDRDQNRNRQKRAAEQQCEERFPLTAAADDDREDLVLPARLAPPAAYPNAGSGYKRRAC